MPDKFSGDIKLILTEDGAEIKFSDGQPVMEQGLENQAFISLFTRQGWAGNYFLRKDSQKVGADFEEAASGAITLTMLNDVRQAAEKALKAPVFGKIDVEVINQVSSQLFITALLQPPGQDILELILTNNGQNWINQKNNPAYKRI